MAFYASEYEKMKAHVSEVRANPSKFGLISGEKLHIWKRLDELEVMAKDEWMMMSEAEHSLIAHYILFMPKDVGFDRRCEIVYEGLCRLYNAIVTDPHCQVILKPNDEGYYQWNYLKTMVLMPLEEFKRAFEADEVLLTGYVGSISYSGDDSELGAVEAENTVKSVAEFIEKSKATNQQPEYICFLKQNVLKYLESMPFVVDAARNYVRKIKLDETPRVE